MDKEKQRLYNLLLRIVDVLTWLVAIAGAYVMRFYLLPHIANHSIDLQYYLRVMPVLIFGYMVLYQTSGLYDPFRRRSILSETGKIIVANFYGLVGIFLVFFWIKEVHISRLVILIFGVSSAIISASTRAAGRLFLRSMRRKGFNIKHILIVGSNETAADFYRKAATNKNYGYVVDGYLNDHPSDYGWRAEYLGAIDQLPEVLQHQHPDEVLISLEYHQFHILSQVISTCELQGVKSSLLPFYSKYLPSQPKVEVFEGIPIINLRHIPLDNLFFAALKRGFDVIASFLGLLLLSPLLLGTIIGIKLTSAGPVIYKQVRIGKNRREFTMYKFRSMRLENNADTTTWGTKNDDRRTRFGAFLRKFSIDELPQLYNVLRGDMSLVGPRPERPFFVEQFRDEVPLYMLKHLVRPGITGWAQINGWRGDTSILERIKCDMFYIENWSFLLDIKILLLTIFKGIVNTSEEL
ncbi:MAG TPA: undecaprenyl-phosphate glucose phosphotransferase [Clostridia bacterium]|nr:undecaprenyl-phosphate glucose phosphotransferase [Clostridia bacterium]